MSVGAPIQGQVLPEPSWPIFRLSVEQYHDMINCGILTEDDPVELLQGILVEKMPKKPGHSAATRKARERLNKVVPSGWFVDSQEPITTEDSEPEPDLAVIRGKPEDFMKSHPRPGDVGMTAEIADSSLAHDRGTKKILYAQAKVPVYWIINLVERMVEVYTDPTGPAERPDYQKRQDYAEVEEVPLVLDGVGVARVPVKELLP